MTEWGAKPKRDNPEARLQAAIVAHLRLLAPKNAIWFHPANGGLRSKKTAAKMKQQGVVPGIADLMFVLPDGRAAAMELKAPKGVLSPFQKAFRDQCALIGVEYAVSSDLDHALGILRAWGVLPFVTKEN